MALPPPSKRTKEPAADPGDAVAQARTRARRRLIGAVVLLGVGIVAFPLVFETQPRPIPVDIPIEIPRKEGAPPLAVPAARPAAAPASVPAPRDDIITESRGDAGRELPASAPQPAVPAAKPAARPAASAPARAGASDPARPAAATSPADPRAADAARAKALLEGETASAPAASRFVVQVGAFADPASAREARVNVEKLGLKTYTQLADTGSGPRTRVRVGPFATRDDAERALARVKAAGIDGVLLTL